ncbi:MAG: hypothetical protein J6B39_03985, partial [Lachnospiraceae bacterium]|nr:hypothetical protein [Lachnospiraceae bacterium]
MINQDRELLALIEDAKNGSMDSYESACNMVYEEVYRLVALVYDKEENRNKLVKYIFDKMYNSIKKYNANKDDIHRWIDIFAIVTMYRVYSQQKGDIFQYNEDGADYEYNYIEDDDRLAQSVTFYNEAIANGNFRKEETSFGKLTKAQIIIYELYCYACCTVDEIEDLLEIDSVYICSEIVALKRKLTNVYFVNDESEERTADRRTVATAVASNRAVSAKNTAAADKYSD